MEWNDRYAVGVPLIDDQHRELFQRLKGLVEALRSGDRREVGRMLEFLGSYVVRHFGTEEREMQRTAYPLLGTHKAAHDRFVREFQALEAEYERTGATQALTLKVNGAVKTWLVEHILGMDQQLAKHLRAPSRTERPPPRAAPAPHR